MYTDSGFHGQVTIEGLVGLNRALDNLEVKVQKKVLRTALRSGAKGILRAVRAAAYLMVGGQMGALLAQSLYVGAKQRGRKFRAKRIQMGVYLAEQAAFREPGGKYYIPAHIEMGHGNAAPIPWMGYGTDAVKEQVLQTIVQEAWKGIEKIWGQTTM